MVYAKCAQCGSIFLDYPCKIRDGRKFCSHTCADASLQADVTDVFLASFDQGEKAACWEWEKAKFKSGGYGALWNGASKKLLRAHRFSYEFYKGPIPDGLHVCHTCDNPPCINPNHLFLGTDKQNSADKVQKGRARWTSRPGESNPAAVLSEKQVRLIRRLKGPATSIAVRFGVSDGTIRSIRNRQTWRHV